MTDIESDMREAMKHDQDLLGNAYAIKRPTFPNRSSHLHQYVTPVEWREDRGDLANNRYATYHVTKLRCTCGEETNR